MNKNFEPDYKNIVDAAYNRVPARLLLYEHGISNEIIERITSKELSGLRVGNTADKREYFRRFYAFHRECGFDVVIHECCVCDILPGGGALGAHKKGIIQNRSDFENYPWDEFHKLYFDVFSEEFTLLSEQALPGMSAVGGVGNGVFEVVQDLVGYEDLCIISFEDPELYSDIFRKVGDMLLSIWKTLLHRFGDVFCICRFGDDLGFKSNTLLPHKDIKDHIIPQYKRIIEVVHQIEKPFLLHSCGNIFSIMDELIEVARIDAKHSNEDQIALFPEWVNCYGDKIGNFGGLDTDMVCSADKETIVEYSKDVLQKCHGHGGFAFGTGNMVASYVNEEKWMKMIETARIFRGE